MFRGSRLYQTLCAVIHQVPGLLSKSDRKTLIPLVQLGSKDQKGHLDHRVIVNDKQWTKAIKLRNEGLRVVNF